MRTTLVCENGLSGQQLILAAWRVATQGLETEGAENNWLWARALMSERLSLDVGRARPPKALRRSWSVFLHCRITAWNTSSPVALVERWALALRFLDEAAAILTAVARRVKYD